MMSTTTTPPQSHHSSVRRPALFLSPTTSANIGHARQNSSPSLPGRLLQSAGGVERRPSLPEVRLALLGALGVGKSGTNKLSAVAD